MLWDMNRGTLVDSTALRIMCLSSVLLLLLQLKKIVNLKLGIQNLASALENKFFFFATVWQLAK
jgi:hypothetical protein